MQFETLDSYECTIKQVVGWRLAADAAKVLGLDADDLASELRFVSWESQMAFRRRHKFCTKEEQLYVRSALWNKAREWRRRGINFTQVMNVDSIVPDTSVDDWGRYEARDQLHRLEDALGSDYSVLERVGEAGGVMPAYKPTDGTPDQFRWRVAQLRRRATNILKDSRSLERLQT